MKKRIIYNEAKLTSYPPYDTKYIYQYVNGIVQLRIEKILAEFYTNMVSNTRSNLEAELCNEEAY
jgi:hypothetical protein